MVKSHEVICHFIRLYLVPLPPYHNLFSYFHKWMLFNIVIQVINYEIVVNFFHISHNFTCRDGRIPLFSCIRIHGYLGYRFFLDTWIIGYLDIMDTWISWIHGYIDIRFLWIHGYLDTLNINFFHYP